MTVAQKRHRRARIAARHRRMQFDPATRVDAPVIDTDTLSVDDEMALDLIKPGTP